MFKKAAEAKSHQRLSGADRKKLKRTIRDRFARASDADIDALIPPKSEITVSKLQNRVVVYSVEGGLPMFFDVDGRATEIFPTVYALWLVPELLPAFTVKAGEVSRFIVGGADLMFPGISVPVEGLPSFSSGEPWAVKVPGNSAPIAVGNTTMSSTEALQAGLRGKALKITHYYPDLLWESADGCYVPNAGFFKDVVLEDPAVTSTQSTNSIDDDKDASSDERVGIRGGEGEQALDSNIEHASKDIEEKVTDAESIVEAVVGLTVSDAGSAEEHIVQKILSTDDVDSLLDRCLLQALHTTVKDKDLPLPGSTLWSKHVLPCRPPGTTLDIKKSSHKKLSKWLEAKSSTGMITVKEDKHKKETMLTSVRRNHEEYSSFKPEKRPTEKNGPQTDHSDENNGTKMLEVMELYKPSSQVNPVFLSVGADTGKLYSHSEASDVVFAYVEKENLVKPTNKAVVVLDAVLCDAIYKGAIKKGSMYPTEIHKKDLGSAFINRMQAHHVVVRGDESIVQKGPVKTIQILTERRQGNKKVTKVTGMETFMIEAESLASELQKKCAASTSVTELPGKKGHEVLVQGGVIDNLAKYLVEHYGVPKRYIEVLDKTRR